MGRVRGVAGDGNKREHMGLDQGCTGRHMQAAGLALVSHRWHWQRPRVAQVTGARLLGTCLCQLEGCTPWASTRGSDRRRPASCSAPLLTGWYGCHAAAAAGCSGMCSPGWAQAAARAPPQAARLPAQQHCLQNCQAQQHRPAAAAAAARPERRQQRRAGARAPSYGGWLPQRRWREPPAAPSAAQGPSWPERRAAEGLATDPGLDRLGGRPRPARSALQGRARPPRRPAGVAAWHARCAAGCLPGKQQSRGPRQGPSSPPGSGCAIGAAHRTTSVRAA